MVLEGDGISSSQDAKDGKKGDISRGDNLEEVPY